MTSLISNTLAAGKPVSSLTASRPGYAEVLDSRALDHHGDAILASPQGCPSAGSFRAQVAALEAQSSEIVAACLNPFCPLSMNMQSKTPQKLTIA